MNGKPIPQDLSAYLVAKLAALHENAMLVFVFDPPARLALGPTVTAGGRVWTVHRYDGNDLAFRRRWTAGGHVVVWVMLPPQIEATPEARLEISSLADLLNRADACFDLSLCGVLGELMPGRAWPEATVHRYADILADNLPAVVEGYRELSLHLGHGEALDAHAVRALALHALQPSIPVSRFLFHKDTALEVLSRYIDLAWGAEWDSVGLSVLQEHARQSPRVQPTQAAAWLDVPPEGLASYLYLRAVLRRGRVVNIANQVRGLGVLSFDPEPLEPLVDQVLTQWTRDPSWRRRLIIGAEANLTDSDLRRAVGLLPAKQPADLLALLNQAETPATIYELAIRLLTTAPETTQLDDVAASWPAYKPAAVADLPETRFREPAQAVVGFLDEIATVIEGLAKPIVSSGELASILDWYVDGRYYDLEFACARAAMELRRLPDRHVETDLQKYLVGLRERVRAYLHQADERLAQTIRDNWKGYLSHPRLSTNVLHDLVQRRRLKPTADACLWVIVFDGMRWDTWQRVVKPRLLQRFEVDESERVYLSLLPSWTSVARTGLLAGQPPWAWKTHDGRFTANQQLLAARLFGIPAAETDQRLQFYSGMESDRIYRQLSPSDRYPWNVLIFNVSDDNLHQERDNLVGLNTKIEALLDSIMQTLESLIGEKDWVVVTSDHGFMELDPQDGVVVEGDGQWEREATGQADPVRYRYLSGMKNAAGFSFEHPHLRESPFTVAVGRRWFKRAHDNREPQRYAHGGLSLAEMVVPGIVMRRIVQKRVDLTLQKPEGLQANEGETLPLELVVTNSGNQPAEFRLVAQANTDTVAQEYSGKLLPAERRPVRLLVRPIYRERGGSTSHVTIEMEYRDAAGKPQKRHHEVPVTVKPRKDVVEIEFGGLDELDKS